MPWRAPRRRCRVRDAGAGFPARRMRRLRRTPALRRLVAETSLGVDDLVAPLFVRAGVSDPVAHLVVAGALPTLVGVARRRGQASGVAGGPRHRPVRDPRRKRCRGVGGVGPRRRSCRWRCPNCAARWATRWCSSPICASTSTPTTGTAACCAADGTVDNDATLELYQRVAVGPGRRRRRHRGAQRDDGRPGRRHPSRPRRRRPHRRGVLAYAAKFASGLYGPFREAVDVTITGGGDRRGYQQDPRNGREALTEVALDIAEGADMVMVKPALAYLDVIAAVAATRRRARGRLSRERRVRHGEGGRRAGMDRR